MTMSVPTISKGLITATEKSRLSDKALDPKIRIRNEMVVRRKIIAWLKDANDIIFALDKISTRTIKKKILDQDIYNLLILVGDLVDLTDFRRIQDTPHGPRVYDPRVFNPIRGRQKLFDKNEKTFRPAVEQDYERIYQLEQLLENLILLLPNPEDISTYSYFKRTRSDDFYGDLPKLPTDENEKITIMAWWSIANRVLYPGMLSDLNKIIATDPARKEEALVLKAYVYVAMDMASEAEKILDMMTAINPINKEIKDSFMKEGIEVFDPIMNRPIYERLHRRGAKIPAKSK